jgi:hypothetical protein
MDPQQQIHSLIAQRNALALQEADSGVKVRPKVTPAPRATTPVEQLVAGTMSGDIQSGKMAELEAMQGEPARLEAMRQEVRLRAAQAAEAGDLAERDRLMAIDMDLRQRISGRIGATEPQESLREKTVPGYASAIAAGQRGFTDTVVASPLSAIDAAAGAMGFDTRMGQSVREGMEAAWPTRPSTEQGFWTGAVPQAAGSAAGFLMTGPLGKAAPLIHGAVVGTGSNYDEARDLDISPTQKTLYTLVGGALGATEGIPIERFIGRLDPGIRQAVTERMLHRLAQEPTKGLTRRVVEEAATQALVESFQEAGQGVGQNIAAKFFGVDPHRNPFDGVSDEALAAMVVGGGMGTMGAVGGEKNRQEILRQYRPQQAGREGQEAADVRTEEQPSAEEGGQLAEGEQAPGDPQRADEGPQEAVDQPPQKTVDSTESTVSSPDADVAAMMEGFDEEIGAAPAPAAESATDTPAAPVAQEPAVPPGDTAGTPRGGPAEIESEVAQAGRKRALDVPGDPGKPPSEFAEGDRVVLPDGTVGTVVKSSTFRMTPIIGGGASAPMTVYDVKTDAGAVRGGFSAERLKPAPARPVGQRGQLAMPGMEAEAEIAEFADRFMPEIERIVGAEVASQYRGPIERYYAAIRRGEDPGQAYGRLYKELPAPATEELDDQLVDVRDRIETEGRADRPAQAETPAAATPVDLDRYEYNVSVADATHPGAPRGQSWITVGRRPKGSTEPFEQVQLIEARGGRTGAMRRAEDAARQYGQSQVFSQFGEGRFVPVGPSKQPLVRIEESAAETSTAPALRIEPYQNAIIVRGETRANKDRIKALGGRWNKRAGGWIFHPSKEAVVREKLGDLLGVRARAHAQPGDALPKYDRGTYRSGPHKGWRYVTVSEGPHKNVIGKGRDLAEAESDLRKVIASREAAKPAAQADVKAPETTEAPEARGVDPHVAARWDAMDYGQREKLAETAYGAMRKVVHRIAGSKWDQLGPGEAQSMAKAMATERPVSAEQAPSLSDKAAAARQELSDAIKEFGDLMDGLAPSNAPLDPRVMKAIGKVIGKSVKAGYYTFAEAMGNVYTQLKAAFGEAKARQMLERAAPTIERAWPAFQQREGRMGPVGRIADIIPTEATDEPGLRGPESAGRPGRGEATGSAEGRRPTPREADTADGEAGTPPQRPPGRPVGDSAEPSGPDGGRGSEPAVGEVAAAGEGPAAPDRGEDRPGVGRPGGKRAGTGRALPDRDVNHIIDPSKPLAPRGNVAKLEANLRAIKLVKKLESENRPATADEKAILARYTGWGWGGELFNEAKWNYRQQREQIQDLLTDEEFASARASALNAHYTSPQVIAPMWDLARRLGFEGGTILEPGMGIGHFFGLMPQDLAAESKLIRADRPQALPAG